MNGILRFLNPFCFVSVNHFSQVQYFIHQEEEIFSLQIHFKELNGWFDPQNIVNGSFQNQLIQKYPNITEIKKGDLQFENVFFIFSSVV